MLVLKALVDTSYKKKRKKKFLFFECYKLIKKLTKKQLSTRRLSKWRWQYPCTLKTSHNPHREKKRKTIKMKMTKPCALEISHNKHREKKEEPNNGDGQKRERSFKMEVSRCLDRKGKGGVIGPWLVTQRRGGWVGFGFQLDETQTDIFHLVGARSRGPFTSSFGHWTKIPSANPSGEHKTDLQVPTNSA